MRTINHYKLSELGENVISIETQKNVEIVIEIENGKTYIWTPFGNKFELPDNGSAMECRVLKPF